MLIKQESTSYQDTLIRCIKKAIIILHTSNKAIHPFIKISYFEIYIKKHLIAEYHSDK